MTRTYEVEKQINQLRKGDLVSSGLGSKLKGAVVGVERYKGEVEAYQGTTTVVINSNGSGFQQVILPNDTECLVECFA